MKETDILRRFIFEKAAIRGIVVHLDASWKAMRERAEYPDVVANELGEFVAANVLLSSTLKYDGSIILQIQGDGPINLMVVEATSQRTLRGLAKWQSDVPEGDLQQQFGEGRLVMTVDNDKSNERYQSVIALEGENVAALLENYLRQSEQLETRMWLAVDGQQATGMLLQKMPGYEDEDNDAWNRAVHLASTIKSDELISLSTEEILRRLFHEEDVRLFDAEPMSFRCSCSRDRVRNMLRTLGPDEVNSIIAEKEIIDVNCEFCNQRYVFDAVDAEAIFASDLPPDSPQTRH